MASFIHRGVNALMLPVILGEEKNLSLDYVTNHLLNVIPDWIYP
jgi:hypothetical protein